MGGYGPLHLLQGEAIDKASEGFHSDGGGLFLQVRKGTDGKFQRAWVSRFWDGQRYRKMGLGSLAAIGAAAARKKAEELRGQVAAGNDPIELARIAKAEKSATKAQAKSFDQCRDAYIAAHRPKWRNVKHADQWTNTLSKYATPVFGGLPVQAVSVSMVLDVLEPLWATIPETASRLRGRIEAVLDWATARGLRQGENPARWRGHLNKILAPVADMQRAKRDRTGRGENFPSLPYSEVGDFMADLRRRPGSQRDVLNFKS